MTTLSDNDPMPFGKYKGEPMEKVPARYLHWMWTEANLKETSKTKGKSAVADYILENLSALETEYKDAIW